MENQTFGNAIEALKHGRKISRQGWNGKGMFLYLKKGNIDGSKLGFKPGEEIFDNHASTIEGVRLGLFENGATDTACRLPNIQMFNANGNTVDGWLASQTDILSEDWCILD